MCFVGLSPAAAPAQSLDPRIRLTSHRTDLAILIILWVQLSPGPDHAAAARSAHRADGGVDAGAWPSGLQGIATLRPDASVLAGDRAGRIQVHLVLGMTIFLLFPFSRLVHVWSGFGTVAFLLRPYQIVRSRRLNVPPQKPRPSA